MSKIIHQLLYILLLVFLLNACDGEVLFRTKPCEEGKVRQGNICVSNTKGSLGDCKDLDLNKIQKGETFTMCDGSIGEGTLVMQSDIPTCTKDEEQNCVAKTKFKALDSSQLDSIKIAKGTTIAGVKGTRRLTAQCRNYSALATFDSSYPPSNMGWGSTSTFLPAAVNTASDQITFTNVHGLITNSLVRFTSTNTLPAPLVAGTTYYAIYVSTTVIQLASVTSGTPIDITTQGTGTHRAYDVGDNTAKYYDTTDDYNNGQTFSPADNPWNNDEYLCDASNFVNVASSSAPLLPSGTTPNTGNQPFTQIWQDQISGNYLTNILYNGVPNNRNWSDAIRTCESLNGGTAGDGWRIPTQKELLQLYIHGISKVALSGGSTSTDFWSSSGNSNFTDRAWRVNLSIGEMSTTNRYHSAYSVICIR